MQQTNKQEQIFLEVTRIRSFATRQTGGDKMRYTARCERCRAKVNLVAQNNAPLRSATGSLHVRLVFGGELLVCPNSLTREAKLD